METVKQLQMNVYQSNTYRKELSWLYFDDQKANIKQWFRWVSEAFLSSVVQEWLCDSLVADERETKEKASYLLAIKYNAPENIKYLDVLHFTLNLTKIS